MRSPASLFARIVHTVRTIAGVPDYAAYCAHIAACHADTPPLSESEFLAERLEARYSRPGSRCC
jgi:uncharacterized short protein YbdD (DUF466 family)